MLAQKNRLRKTKDIDAVFKTGKTAFLPSIGIKIRKNDLETSRITVLVSTKISKKAVERNRLKRQIKAVFSTEIENFSSHYDIVVITKKESLDLEYTQLEKNIKTLLKRVKVY